LVEEIEDIGEVADDVNSEDGTGRAKVVKGDIVGILGMLTHIKVAVVAMERSLIQKHQLEFAANAIPKLKLQGVVITLL